MSDLLDDLWAAYDQAIAERSPEWKAEFRRRIEAATPSPAIPEAGLSFTDSLLADLAVARPIIDAARRLRDAGPQPTPLNDEWGHARDDLFDALDGLAAIPETGLDRLSRVSQNGSAQATVARRRGIPARTRGSRSPLGDVR